MESGGEERERGEAGRAVRRARARKTKESTSARDRASVRRLPPSIIRGESFLGACACVGGREGQKAEAIEIARGQGGFFF